MGFGAISIVMLVVVLIFYMRMVDSRMSGRKTKSQIHSILEKVSVFESVGDDDSAEKLLEEMILAHSKNAVLLERLEQIKRRRKDASTD